MTATTRIRRGLLAAAGLACAALLAPGAATAQTRPTVGSVEAPRSALFIGNSFFYFNNGMPGMITAMLRAEGAAPIRSTMITISGSGADWHDVGSYFRPNAVGRYSFDPQNNIVFNQPGARLFDVAVMMDCSACPVHPQLASVFTDFARRHAETVRSHGATPVFFMSWAYKDRPEMTQGLAEAYTAAGNANNALVIPAGLAFARAYAERPALNLHAPDLRHPSVAGTYLAAATTYAALLGRTPVGNSFTAGLDAESAAFLQRVAWETVREYHGTQRAAAN